MNYISIQLYGPLVFLHNTVLNLMLKLQTETWHLMKFNFDYFEHHAYSSILYLCVSNLSNKAFLQIFMKAFFQFSRKKYSLAHELELT